MKNYKHKHNNEVVRFVETSNGFFTVFGECIPRRFIENSSDWIEMKNQPKLITEDNIKLFEGDKYWCADKHDWTIFSGVMIDGANYKTFDQSIIFSNKESAKQYIYLNKPIFNRKELLRWSEDNSHVESYGDDNKVRIFSWDAHINFIKFIGGNKNE